MELIDLRKLLRKDAPGIYQSIICRDPTKKIPDETPNDFIQDLENYQKKLDAQETKRQEEATWKKL